MTAPFKNVAQCIAYYRNCNPARARYLNLIERDRKNKPSFDAFDAMHPHRIWAALATSIEAVCNRNSAERVAAWRAYDILRMKAVVDIAKALGKGERTVWQWIADLRDELESDCIAKGLIDPDKADE